MKPLVAIVGRPNVGKSSLFNRLVGKKRALVFDEPGITRDRQYAEVDWDRHLFDVVDTGGIDLYTKANLQKKMTSQALQGIKEASLVLVLMDAKVGLTPHDREWIEKARQFKIPKIFVVNKVDTAEQQDLLAEFYELGVNPLMPISAETGRGISELLDKIVEIVGDPSTSAEASVDEPVTSDQFNISIIGRPNVGKSTLLNALLQEERAIVDATPGTTRDTVNTYLQIDGHNLCLMDTAGIRRQGRISQKVEKVSVTKALGSLGKSHCALLVLDAIEGITEQDAHVAGEAFNQRKILLILVNKWDEASSKTTQKEFQLELERKMNFLEICPVLFISAKTGLSVQKIFPTILRIKAQYEMRIPTSQLNRAFEKVIKKHPLPVYRGRNINIYYATQVSASPPTFAIFSNEPSKIHFSYQRYLVNSIREVFGFKEVPLRLLFRKKR